jgi:hypothetical protein
MDLLSWTIVEVLLVCTCHICYPISIFLLSSTQNAYRFHGSAQQRNHILQTVKPPVFTQFYNVDFGNPIGDSDLVISKRT